MAKKKASEKPTGRFRDRIRGLERVRAGDMEEHPGNWRLHPGKQVGAVTGMLSEIGKADVLLAFPADGLGADGDFSRLMMYDGHLRRSIDPDETWPVIVTDLTRAEADKMLVTLDPLAGMAECDPMKLDTLLRGVQTATQEVADLLASLAEDAGIISGDGGSGGGPGEPDSQYTNKVMAPIYEPKGERPPISALINRTKTEELIAGIDASELPEDVKQMMRWSAERHTVFNFRQIAEYYCHANETLQDLMERSGMIIIDFNKAIEYGFVHMTEKLGELVDIEESDA